MQTVHWIPRLAALSLMWVALGSSIAASAEGVFPSADAVEPLAAGARVPNARVESVGGRKVDIADRVADRGALLVFYRGGWCPYCSTQLSELRKIEDDLAELGFPVIAISPDRPVRLSESLEAGPLGYALYSDSMLAAAKAFGIAFQLTPAEVARYDQVGVDLEEASGQRHHQLPVPSVFLVSKGGTIRWVYSNPDYKVRPDNASLLAAAQEFAETP